MSDGEIRLPAEGVFLGRAFADSWAHPAVVTVRDGTVVDITSKAAPTSRDVCEQPDPVGFVKAAAGKPVGALADIAKNSFSATRDPKKPHLLSGNGGPVLGLIEDAKFTEFSAHLEPGDAVIGYTDGVVDRRQSSPLASLATRLLKGYREGGSEALLSLPLPQVTDEACLVVLQVED